MTANESSVELVAKAKQMKLAAVGLLSQAARVSSNDH